MYSIIKLKKELVEKGVSDDGLVAWGSSASGSWFGAIGGALASMHVICKNKDAILIIPFTNKEIIYSKMEMFSKQIIAEVSLKGFLSKTLYIKTVDGKNLKYPITQGASAVKEMLDKIGC